MAISAVSSRWKLLVAAGTAMVAIACGGDDTNSKVGDAGTVPPPNTNNPSTGFTPAAGVVGKTCAADTECGALATCAKKQGFGTLSDLATAAGLDTQLDAPGGYCTTSCGKDSDCGPGSVCLGAALGLLRGECRKSCTSNTDCRAPEYECAKQMIPTRTNDAGVANPGAAGLALAPQCQALPKTDKLADNQTGLACVAEGTPDAGVSPCGDGFCAAGACTGICVKDSDCGANAACVPTGILPGSAGTCQETCSVDTDCARYVKNGGIGCIDVDTRKLCGPKQFPLDPGLVGKACTANTECGSGDCATTLGTAAVPAPGGYCSLLGCTADAQCGGGTCVGSNFGSRCYANCTADTQCRTGYTCQERATVGMTTGKVCAPPTPVRDGGTPSTDSGTPSTPVTPSDAGVAPVVDAG